MRPVPELVVDERCELAEGPIWHPDECCLCWTDIPAGTIYRFDPRREIPEVIYRGEPVGGITVQDDGALLLLGARGRISLWRHGRITEIVPEIPAERGTRFNDVIADPAGRVLGGTMAIRGAMGAIVRPGRLYRIDFDGAADVLLDGLGTPNGMGFSPDLETFYFTDSIAGVQAIFRFDYDHDNGTPRNRTLLAQTPLDGSQGRPDGLTVDADGWLWSARWDGGAVVRLDPDGRERERYELPVRKVTSLTFGGDDLADLYITTASIGVQPNEEAGAGGVFRLRTGTRGKPEFRSRIARPVEQRGGASS